MEKGYNDYRLNDNRNFNEQTALDIFEKYGGERLIAQIKKNGTDTDSLSLNERRMAATIIQWLGSHVGQCYIRDFLAAIDTEGK